MGAHSTVEPLQESEQREVNCKLVVFGPQGAGKSACMRAVRGGAEQRALRSGRETEVEFGPSQRCEYLKVELGRLHGLETRLHVYGLNGAGADSEHWEEILLRGLGGVLLVLDSRLEQVEANLRCLERLQAGLSREGQDLQTLPAVILWTKRDLPDALPLEELQALFNQRELPAFEVDAEAGQGVLPAVKELAARALGVRRAEFERSETRRLKRIHEGVSRVKSPSGRLLSAREGAEEISAAREPARPSGRLIPPRGEGQPDSPRAFPVVGAKAEPEVVGVRKSGRFARVWSAAAGLLA